MSFPHTFLTSLRLLSISYRWQRRGGLCTLRQAQVFHPDSLASLFLSMTLVRLNIHIHRWMSMRRLASPSKSQCSTLFYPRVHLTLVTAFSCTPCIRCPSLPRTLASSFVILIARTEFDGVIKGVTAGSRNLNVLHFSSDPL